MKISKKLKIQNRFLVIKKRKSIKTQIHQGTEFFLRGEENSLSTKKNYQNQLIFFFFFFENFCHRYKVSSLRKQL